MTYARLEQAIIKMGAKLLVLEPIQAYLGGNVDMHCANEIRQIVKRLGMMAERNDCAVLLVGHMNKMQGAKSAYRGLGSIDFRAAARSVLLIGCSKDEPTVRIAAHDKSSLAPEGKSVVFEPNPDTGFAWRGCSEALLMMFSLARAAPHKAKPHKRLHDVKYLKENMEYELELRRTQGAKFSRDREAGETISACGLRDTRGALVRDDGAVAEQPALLAVDGRAAEAGSDRKLAGQGVTTDSELGTGTRETGWEASRRRYALLESAGIHNREVTLSPQDMAKGGLYLARDIAGLARNLDKMSELEHTATPRTIRERKRAIGQKHDDYRSLELQQ